MGEHPLGVPPAGTISPRHGPGTAATGNGLNGFDAAALNV